MMGIVNDDESNTLGGNFEEDDDPLYGLEKSSYQGFPVSWYCVLGTVFVSVMGSFFHFAYQWTCCNWLVGLFVAVNESVFEHLKLLIFPLILFWILNGLLYGNMREHLIGLTAAIYSGVLFLCVGYFTWKIIFVDDKLWFDILLFIISSLVAQLTGWYYALDELRYSLCSLMVVVPLFMVSLMCYLCFTDFPPHIESFFGDPTTGLYGRPIKCKC